MAKSPPPDIDELIGQYERGVLSDEELAAWIEIDPARSKAFEPWVQSVPDPTRSTRGVAVDSIRESLVPALNRASKRRRRSIFLERMSPTFSGSVVVSEGDSWFQFPVLLKDVVDYLIDDESLAVLSLGAAGETMSQMLASGELSDAAREYQPDYVLISAGGNDVLAQGGVAMRLNVTDELLNAQWIEPKKFIADTFYDSMNVVLENYRKLITSAVSVSPHSKVLIHGYDYVWPEVDGTWLGIPMREAGIEDAALQRRVARAMLSEYNTELRKLAETFTNVTWVDMRGEVGRGRWFDELHPDNDGYLSVAQEFARVMRAIA